MNDGKILKVNANANLPQGSPAAACPFAVIIGNRRFGADDLGVPLKGIFADCLPAENFDELSGTTLVGG